MTHQTLSLGKYWKLFRATLKTPNVIEEMVNVQCAIIEVWMQ